MILVDMKFFGSSMFKFAVFALAAVYPMIGVALAEDRLGEAIRIERGVAEAAAQSQETVSQLSRETEELLRKYKSDRRQTESLRAYNAALEKLIDGQKEEMQSLGRQIDRAAEIERDIIPLIAEMVDVLAKFVALDLRFLVQERANRIDGLKLMLSRSDISTAEKFRKVLEAYQVESEYGRTIEAYRSDITLQGETYTVDLLRIGRLALLYRTLDGSAVGYWSSEQDAWQFLPSEYDDSLRKGLSIARKQAAPDLLVVPVSMIKASK